MTHFVLTDTLTILTITTTTINIATITITTYTITITKYDSHNCMSFSFRFARNHNEIHEFTSAFPELNCQTLMWLYQCKQNTMNK